MDRLSPQPCKSVNNLWLLKGKKFQESDHIQQVFRLESPMLGDCNATNGPGSIPRSDNTDEVQIVHASLSRAPRQGRLA